MNKIKLLFVVALIALGFSNASAQIAGYFSWYGDGHLYFTATNQTMYTITVRVVAHSDYNEIERAEYQTLPPGGGFYLGPTTPWRWYWHSGDRISIKYPNGQIVYWVCEETESRYSSIYPQKKYYRWRTVNGCADQILSFEREELSIGDL